MRRCFLIFLMSLAVPAFSQSKHPFTFEDMMKLKRVGEPEVSPDGKWVIFSVVDVDLAANTRTPHIWIVALAGGQEREITSSQDAYRPRWAPDGKRFAFISNKESGSQVWIADFDGAAGTVTGMHELTSIATEADGELWSPDGKNIFFVSNVYPECPDEACNAKKLEEAANSKVKAMIFTRLLYRHAFACKEGKRSHIFVIPVDACVGTAAPGCSAGAARDLTPGDYDSPVLSFGQDGYAFSPDGQEICYTSNHDKNEAASTNNDLWIVPVAGGPAKNITADNPASDSTPLYSPDGKYIAYRAQQRPGYESDRFRLMLYDRKTGEKKNLTEKLDRWIGTFVWAPDSSRIYFVREEAGKSPVAVVPVPDGFLSTLIRIETGSPGGKRAMPISNNSAGVLFQGFYDDLSVSLDGKTLFFTGTSLQSPNEIFGASVSDLQNLPVPHRISRMNDNALSQVSMSPLESFWFTGAHGDKVEGFLVKPPNFDASKNIL